MTIETNAIDTLTKLASEHWNDTNVKVSNRNKSIVESIKDHNQGNPNQNNRGHFYRYTVTFIDGIEYGSDNLEDIRSKIVYSGRHDYDNIVKCYFESQEIKLESSKSPLTQEMIDYINNDICDTETAYHILQEMRKTPNHKKVKTGDKIVAFFPHFQYNEFKIIGIHYKSETVTIANTKGFIQSYNVSFEKIERDFKESFTEKPIKIKGVD